MALSLSGLLRVTWRTCGLGLCTDKVEYLVEQMSVIILLFITMQYSYYNIYTYLSKRRHYSTIIKLYRIQGIIQAMINRDYFVYYYIFICICLTVIYLTGKSSGSTVVHLLHYQQ
jgi:hypothetical protein